MKNTEEVVSRIVFDIVEIAHKDTDVPKFYNLHKGGSSKRDLPDRVRAKVAIGRRQNLVFALGVTRGIILLLLVFAFGTVFYTSPSIFYDAYSCTSFEEGGCKPVVLAHWDAISDGYVVAALYTVAIVMGIRAFLKHRLRANRDWFVNRSNIHCIVSFADVFWVVALASAVTLAA